jgi:glycosyltransferase involved in cell wall biosynthesis
VNGSGRTTISVVIATYGDESWHELARGRAFKSALAQNPYEVVLRHEHEGTLAEARNTAAASAGGEWLCFLDADDEIAPGYLDAMQIAQHELLRDPTTGERVEHGLLAPRAEFVHPDGSSEGPMFPNRHRPMSEMNHCVIGTLVPSDLFHEVEGFPEYPMFEDWALFLACVRAGARIIDVEGAVYRAYLRANSRNVGIHAAETYAAILNAHAAASRDR